MSDARLPVCGGKTSEIWIVGGTGFIITRRWITLIMRNEGRGFRCAEDCRFGVVNGQFFIVFMHLTPLTPRPLFPLFPRLRSGQALWERGPGGEVPIEGGASAARKIVHSVLSMVSFSLFSCTSPPLPPNPLFPLSLRACPERRRGKRGPGGEVPKEGIAFAARMIITSFKHSFTCTNMIFRLIILTLASWAVVPYPFQLWLSLYRIGADS